MSEPRTSLAIVLRWRAYGESDKIVTFLTESFGKLTGIAKGAKRSRRRFVNSLEPLARVRVHFRLRPGATLAFLDSCELLHPLDSLTEPTRFAYASYLTELAEQLTVEEHPVRELYALLDEGLSALEEGPATSAFLRGFELQMLGHAGYEPQLEHCHNCRRPASPETEMWLDAAHGTFHCRGCRRPGGSWVEVSGGTLQQLLSLRGMSLADCRRQSLGALSDDAAQITSRLLALHLTRPLQSVKFIAQLTAPQST